MRQGTQLNSFRKALESGFGIAAELHVIPSGADAETAKGLLGKKRVIVVTARGATYEKGTPSEKFDFQEPNLRHIFGFIGLMDVKLIHAENQLREGAGPSLAAAAEVVGRLASEQSHQVVY